MANGLELEGLDKVLREFDKTEPRVRQAAMKGLEAGAMDIIADAQTNLRSNGSVVTGLLRQSAKVQKVDEDNIEAGFFDTKNQGSGYAAFVEYGRRAGKMPPPDELVAYAKKKLRLDWQAAKAVGWAMAKKIAAQGTKPHPFFEPAMKKNQKRILERVRESINKAD